MSDQVPLSMLLEDAAFRTWFNRKPADVPNQNWMVYVQEKEEGPWARMKVKSWKKGMKFVNKHLGEYYDMTLNCANWQFRPPVVRRGTAKVYYWPADRTDHYWCGGCRRPTLFRYFTKHHAFRTFKPIPHKLRCSICGHSLDGLKRYRKGTG